MNRFLNGLVVKTLISIFKDLFTDICCMNCMYYWLILIDDSDDGYCIIDKQDINSNISHIVKCNAFELWFGVVN